MNLMEKYILDNKLQKEDYKCPYCNNNKTFKGSFDGFTNTCNDKKCISKMYTETKRKQYKENLNINVNEFVIHILNNLDFYKNKIIEGKQYMDTFLKQLIPYRPQYNFKKYLQKMTRNDDRLKFSSKCKYCGNIYYYFMLDDRKNICNKRNCNIRKSNDLKFGWNQINKNVEDVKIEILNLLNEGKKVNYVQNYIKKYFKDHNELSEKLKFFSFYNDSFRITINNEMFSFGKKTDMFERFLKYYNYDKKDFYLKYLNEGEHYSYCKSCNKLLLHSINSNSNKTFCSSECYWEMKRKHPELYFSEERNKKQSETMKRKIANGEFTPCITNTWTHWTNIYKGKKFRSFYELIFHILHPSFLYEYTRIKYRKPDKSISNYILDFTDTKRKNYI